MPIRPYQKQGVAFGYTHPANYQMVDLGLGKTLIALNLVQLAKIPAIVLAPLRVAYMTWPSEIQKWTPNLSYTILHGKNKDANLRLNRHIYILNYEGLPWFYRNCLNQTFKLRKYFFILDEASLFKDPSTMRFKLLKHMTKMMSKYRVNLSATPAPMGYHNLWSQYYILDEGQRLERFYSTFRDKYFSYYPPPKNKTIPLPGAEEKIRLKVKDITFRLDEKDYLAQPDPIINNIRVDMPPKLLAKYHELRTESMLKFSEDIKSTAFNDAALSNKCRQFLQGAVYTDTTGQRFGPKPYKQLHDIKAQMLKELCDYMPGKPILAAFQYRFELDIFNRVFNYRVPYIAGGISGVESTTILQKWNLGTIPLLLVHPASVSHGLNLQEAGCTLVWVALPWSLEQYLQLLGRLRRSGQKNVVGVHNFLFKDTIDDRIGRVLAMRDASQQDLLDALKEEFGYGHSRSGR